MSDQDPAIRTFQFDDGGFTGAIKKSVNLFRGSINLPLPILQLPGRNGTSVSVSTLYTGVTPQQATTWNLEEPTGILGLGWDMPLEQITVSFAPGTTSSAEAQYYLQTAGQVYALVSTEPNVFVANQSVFWAITYDPDSEVWSVVRDDGSTWTYGGDGPGGRFVDYGVTWGNWRDASTQRGGQQVAVAWKLQSIQSTWGDTTTYAYSFDDQPIGPSALNYTRACYLSQIVDCFGRTLSFNYEPKTFTSEIQEYMPPHISPSGSGTPYQDVYETQYLSSIRIADAGAQTLFDVLIGSTVTDFSGTGAPGLFKRTLNSLALQYPGRAPEAGIQFGYLPAGSLSAGLLATASYEQGAQATYNYGQVALGNALVIQPVRGGQGDPRVWFGPDYAVFTFFDSDSNSLSLQVYSWMGGWFESEQTPLTVPQGVTIDDLQVNCSEGFFVVYYTGITSTGETNAVVFVQSSYAPDQWTPTPLSSTVATVAIGTRCFVTQSLNSSILQPFTVVDGQTQPQPGPAFQVGSANVALAGAGENFVAMACDTSSQTANLYYIVLSAGQWSMQPVSANIDSIYWASWVAGTFWSVGYCFAAATWISADQSSYTVAALSWASSSDAPRWVVLGNYPVPSSGNLPFSSSVAVESTIGNCQNVWRYDGEEWQAATIGPVPPVSSGTAASFSYWADAAVMAALQGSSTAYTLITFDPYSNSWNTPLQLPEGGAAASAPYPATLGQGFMTVGRQLYAEDQQENWNAVQAGLLGTSVNPASPINLAPQLIVSQDEEGQSTNVMLLKNGTFVPQAGASFQSIFGQICYVPPSSGEGPQPGCVLGGPSSFVTYPTGSTFGPGVALTLYRVVDPSFQPGYEYQTAAVVTGLSIDDGQNTYNTAYNYNVSSSQDGQNVSIAEGASYGQGSPIPQFSRVAVQEGTADFSENPPCGTRYKYFLNGVRPTAGGVFYPSGEYSNLDSSNYGTANGMLVHERLEDGGGNPVQVQLNYWWANIEQVIGGSAYYLTTPRSVMITGAVLAGQVGATAAMIDALNDGDVPPPIAAALNAQGMALGTTVDVLAVDVGVNWLVLDDTNDRGFLIVYDAGSDVFSLWAGLRTTQTTAYNATNGKPSTQSIVTCDSEGNLTQVTKAVLYLCDVQPQVSAELNLLTPIVQVTTQAAPLSDLAAVEYLSSEVSLWWPWTQAADGMWAPSASFTASAGPVALSTKYVWLGPASDTPPSFDGWENGSPDPTVWQQADSITLRTPHGLLAEMTNTDGVAFSRVYTADESVKIAQIENCRVSNGEGAWYGFESYESNPGWAASDGQPPQITTNDAHTGLQCASVAPGGFLAYPFNPGRPIQYLFSCWVKSTAPATSSAWTFTGSSGPAGPPLPINGPVNEWTYVMGVLDLSAAEQSGPIQVSLNNTSGAAILVDELRLCPFVGGLTAAVLDPHWRHPTATIDENGHPTYRAYDLAARVAGSSRAGSVLTIAASWDAPVGPPQPGQNGRLDILARTSGSYTFYNSTNWMSVWTPDSAAAWTVSQGVLQFGGSAPSTLQLSGWDTSSPSAVQFELLVPAPLSESIQILAGSQITITLEPDGANGTWTVADSGGGQPPAPVANPRAQAFLCCVAISGGYLFLFVDGLPIVSYATSYAATAQGTLALRVAETGTALRHLLLATDPILTLKYLTGTGQDDQLHVLDAGQAAVSAKLRDLLGRNAVTTKPAFMAPDATHALLAYRGDFAVMDWTGGPLTGSLNDYYSPGGGGATDDGGYPFHRIAYDDTPLSRVAQVGRAGLAYAITGSNSHIAQAMWGINTPATFGTLLSLPAAQFSVLQATDPDGIVSFRLKDKRGRTIAMATAPEGGGGLWLETYLYDAQGNLLASSPPNAFTPPQGTSGADFISTASYDAQSRMVEITSPDGGTVNLIYSPAGRLRFKQDARGASEGYFQYWTYDVMGRMLELGTISAEWSDSTLQGYANNLPGLTGQPDWPTPSVDGLSWSQRASYDGDGTQPNCVTRVIQIQTQTGGVVTSETYTYDDAGHVLSITTQPGSETADVVQYQYDAAGNPVGATSSGLFSHALQYGVRNELVSVGTAEDPAQYASYSYLPTGALAYQTLGLSAPLEVPHQYDPSGSLLQIGSSGTPFTEQMYYTQRADGSAGYFNGRMAAAAISYSGASAPTTPLSWDYQLDAQSQLQSAACNNPEWSVGTAEQPVSYDASGNLQSLQTGGVTQGYTYVANQVQTITGGSAAAQFSYDANGLISGVPSRSLIITSDPRSGLPTAVTIADGPAVSYVYGSRGQRLLKTVVQDGVTSTIRYVYGMHSVPLALITQTGSAAPVVKALAYGPTGLVAIDGAGGTLFVLKDHQGSTRAVLDGQGNLQAGYDYLPFGQLGRSYGPLPGATPYLYTGQEWEPEISLYNYRSRYYDVALGRFYGPDPMNQYASPYVYVGNNPVMLADFSGSAVWWEILASAAILLVGVALTIWTGGLTAGMAVEGELELGEVLTSLLAGSSTGALTGAGTQGIQFGIADSASSPDAAKWGEMLGLGAATGAITGFMGKAGTLAARMFPNAMQLGAVLTRIGFNTIGGAASSGTGAAMLAHIEGPPLTGTGAGIAILVGGATAFLTTAGSETSRAVGAYLNGTPSLFQSGFCPARVVRFLVGGAIGAGSGVAIYEIQNHLGDNVDSLGMSIGLGAVTNAIFAVPRLPAPLGGDYAELDPNYQYPAPVLPPEDDDS